MYLNLLFKSLKVDANSERVKAFVKRFVQVLGCGGGGGTEFIAGGLYLLGEVRFVKQIWILIQSKPRCTALQQHTRFTRYDQSITGEPRGAV